MAIFQGGIYGTMEHTIKLIGQIPGLSGMVAYYNMDSNVNDQTGNGNNASIISNISYINSTNGLLFDKTASFNYPVASYIEVPFNSSFNGTSGTQLTVMCRVVRLPQASHEDMTFVDLYGSWNLASRKVSGDIVVTAGGVTANIAGECPADNVNTHLAFTYDGANIKVYKNGTQVGSNTAATGTMTGTGVLCIGKRTAGGDKQVTTGYIEEVAIFNRALSSTEISNIANATTPIIYY